MRWFCRLSSNTHRGGHRRQDPTKQITSLEKKLAASRRHYCRGNAGRDALCRAMARMPPGKINRFETALWITAAVTGRDR